MKQQNLLTKMLLLFALVVGSVSSVWAEETPIVSADFTIKTAKHSEYTDTWTYGDWSLTNCANNNGGWEYIRCGGKGGSNATDTKTSSTVIQGTKKINTAIKEVKLLHNGKSNNNFTVNSLVLEVSSKSDFSVIENTITLTPTITKETAGTVTFNTGAPYAVNSYYRVTINWTVKGKSNYGLDVTKVEFYEDVVSSPLTSIAVTGTYPTSFYVNDEFSHEGAVVTATYEDASTKDVSASATFSAPDMTSTGTKTVTVSYTEGEVTEKTTYDITVNARPALTSIALSGTYTTIFEQGSTFNHDGVVVTATYADNSTKDVTVDATFSTPDMTTLGTQPVTVSYTENEITKSTSYDITVNEYVQPAEITLTISQSLFPGVTFNSTTNQTTQETISTTFDNVTMTIKKGTSGTYVKDGEFRCYKEASLVFDAPNGYYLKKIEFTKGSSWGMNSANPGTLESQTWTAASNTTTVTFGFSGRTDITGVKVYLAKAATITLASACTDGTNYFGTYSNESAFVVPSGLTVSAVSVSGGKLTVTNYATGDIVKAGTGVMVSSATDGDHTVLLSSETGTEISGNMLKGSGAGITAEEMSAENTTFYRLTMHNGTQIGFWWGAENGAAFSLAANKAYLAVPESASAPALGFEFGGDTTGISQHLTPNTQQQTYYDLSGRRVAQPTKGLYILNGKKVLVK